MDFSFDHSQIPIVGRKALGLPTGENEQLPPKSEPAPSMGTRERGRGSVQTGGGDSHHSTLERRDERASLSPGVSLSEHSLGWKKSDSGKVREIVALVSWGL